MNIIQKIIETSKKIIVLPHISADGDSLGSSLAIGLSLCKIGKEVDIIMEEKIVFNYTFLPGIDKVQIYNGQKNNYDTVIALDSGDLNRLGKRKEYLSMSDFSINIDHHPTNTNFAKYNIVDSSASSVGEMVYDILKSNNLPIDDDIVKCIYTAIISDTGGFKYSNTTSKTHEVVSELLRYKIDVEDISRRVFDMLTIGKLKLISYIINDIEILEDNKIAVLYSEDEVLDSFGAKDDDYDGIINFARNIENVEIAVMFRKKLNGDIKVNLRSNKNVDVSEIAKKYGGGGHKKASGMLIKEDYKVVREKIIKDVSSELQNK